MRNEDLEHLVTSAFQKLARIIINCECGSYWVRKCKQDLFLRRDRLPEWAWADHTATGVTAVGLAEHFKQVSGRRRRALRAWVARSERSLATRSKSHHGLWVGWHRREAGGRAVHISRRRHHARRRATGEGLALVERRCVTRHREHARWEVGVHATARGGNAGRRA